jgi:hypothetical protein
MNSPVAASKNRGQTRSAKAFGGSKLPEVPKRNEMANLDQKNASTAIEIARLLSQARMAIEAGDKREAAFAIFMVREMYDVTQQKIAAAVGKSQPWVSVMLRWHRKGFKDTPFGPASNDARFAARFGRLMGRKLPRGLVRLWIRTRLAPNKGPRGVLVIEHRE